MAGYFVWKPEITDEEEISYLSPPGKWSPATVDFLEVMGSKTNTGMGDFAVILATIAQYDPGTVKRVNFMTHANSNLMGIRGTIDSDNVHFTVSVDHKAVLSYDGLNIIGLDQKTKYTMDEIRARFAKEAVFVLYACKAGNNTKLMEALNQLLRVRVIGFKNEIVYCPRAQSGSTFNRKGMKIGINTAGFTCAANAVTDWRGLIKHPNAISVP